MNQLPTTGCDGYHDTGNNGTNKYLVPFDSLYSKMKTVGAMKILFSVTYYGGYIVDDTYGNRATFCVEQRI